MNLWVQGHAKFKRRAVFFSLFFPVVLIAVFGALSGGGGFSLDVGFDSRTDTTNGVYQAIAHIPVIHFARSNDSDLLDRLRKGRITALIVISPKGNPGGKPQYDVHLKTTSAFTQWHRGLPRSCPN